ncbi:MAG TPA: hypothetical protein VGI39_39730 [Polyangiaceae bacterium]
MGRVIRCGPGDLARLLEEDQARLDGAVKTGMVLGAVDGARAIENNLPIAFGKLRGSLHVDAAEMSLNGPPRRGKVRVVLDAPHAAALETGSRPHTPPLGPLLAWVKLRGMQGIDAKGNIRKPTRRAWGNTTAANAHSIAVALRQLESTFRRTTPIDAPMKIARAIQAAIAKHGTRPHWMVRSSMPKIDARLGTRLRKAVKS